jgi:hypothetical protein
MDFKTLRTIAETIEEPRAINISGLGEPLLHPFIDKFISALVACNIEVQLNTNGILLTQTRYDYLVDAGLSRLVLTSDYRPWDRGRLFVQESLPVTFYTITREPDHPELGQVRKPLDDWGGQVGSAPRAFVRCSFLHDDFVQVCWDGTVQRCCCDFNAEESLGHVNAPAFHKQLGNHQFASWPISLCSSCAGYAFTSGIVAGDYAGTGETTPDAFLKGD